MPDQPWVGGATRQVARRQPRRQAGVAVNPGHLFNEIVASADIPFPPPRHGDAQGGAARYGKAQAAQNLFYRRDWNGDAQGTLNRFRIKGHHGRLLPADSDIHDRRRDAARRASLATLRQRSGVAKRAAGQLLGQLDRPQH